MPKMPLISITFALIGLLCILWARTYNGKGMDGAVVGFVWGGWGVLCFIVSAIFFLLFVGSLMT